jgi:hypothetical protein
VINPYTGLDENDPSGILGSGMPRPPATDQIVDTSAPMPPGGAGAGMPPELAQAQQVLAQADAVLGPSQGMGPAAGAPGAPPPPAPAPMGSAAPAPTPAIPTTTAGQRQYLRQEQFAGLERGQQLDGREQELAQQQAGAKTGAAAINAGQANLSSVNQDREQEELQAAQNLFAGKLATARQASDQATQTWVNAKPEKWLPDDPTSGTRLATAFGIALAYGVDAMNQGQGVKSNLGQQAVQLVNEKIDQHRAEEMARIEQLKQRAVAAGQDVQKVEHQYALDTAKIEQRYAGIEKALEMRARSERASLGMEQARIDGDMVVVAQARRAEEAQARRLDAVNRFVNAETALEMRARRGSGKGGPKPLTEYQQMMKDRHDEEVAIFNLDGSPAGNARTKQEAVKLRAAQESTAGFVDNIKRLQEFIDREGTVQVPLVESSARKELEGLMTSIAGNLTIMNQTGILVDSEYRRYKGIVSPSAWQSNEGAKATVAKLATQAEEYYARKVRSQGATTSTPGSQGPTQPETMPGMKPQGTSTWPPADVEMLQKARAGHPRAAEIIDALTRKYGAGAVDGR